MAMRSLVVSRSALLRLSMDSSSSRSAFRFFSDQGRVLNDEERAAENVYIRVHASLYLSVYRLIVYIVY